MFPAPFEYQRAASVADAVSLLRDGDGEARVIAGGQSLLPLMKLRLAAPAALIDISRIEELSFIREDQGQLVIGALTTFSDVERSDLVRRRCPALAHVAGEIGDPQVRHRGTVGGTLAHADPASDLPAMILALDGQLSIVGPRGSRIISSADLAVGFLSTSLDSDEIISEVRIPAGVASYSYEKFTRRSQEWAIVGVATVRDSVDRHVNVSVANCASTPRRARTVEAALASGTTPADAVRMVVEDIEPVDDAVATADYRSELAAVLLERALKEMDAGAGV